MILNILSGIKTLLLSILFVLYIVCTFIEIHLKDCTALNTPPKEIVSRGFLAVMGYLKRLRLGAVQCKRTKLMMVGLGGAGKTRY